MYEIERKEKPRKWDANILSSEVDNLELWDYSAT
jgi:hypothetical protein